MDTFDKYFRLTWLLLAGFIGIIGTIVLIFFILKLCSVSLSHLPGFDFLFRFFITIIPYLFFLGGYNYMRTKLAGCPKKGTVLAARIIMVLGVLFCLITIGLKLAFLWGVRKNWLLEFDHQAHYGLIIQIFLLFLTAMVLATGDPKEKNWWEKETVNPS